MTDSPATVCPTARPRGPGRRCGRIPGAALAVLLASLTAAAAQPMTGAEFEAYVQGKTLTYASQGVPYGVEQYYPDRRVRWAFSDDECIDGVWYQQDDMICFAYEREIEPQCWTFEKGPQGLIARFRNDPGAGEIYEAFQSSAPMACLGPKVGV